MWVVIPAYNEERNIANVLREVLSYTKNIIVVDDFSRDRTQEIVKEFPVHLLAHKINRGQGAALQTGNEYALKKRAEYIVHFDGDGQMQVKDIPALLEPLQKGEADITFGSRYLGSVNHVPKTKQLFIHTPARVVNWVLTGLWLSDAHCGFRALSKNAATVISITQDRMAHATEIPDQVRRHSLRYREVPVEVLYHEYGQKLSGAFRILKDIFIGKLIRK